MREHYDKDEIFKIKQNILYGFEILNTILAEKCRLEKWAFFEQESDSDPQIALETYFENGMGIFEESALKVIHEIAESVFLLNNSRGMYYVAQGIETSFLYIDGVHVNELATLYTKKYDNATEYKKDSLTLFFKIITNRFFDYSRSPQ